MRRTLLVGTLLAVPLLTLATDISFVDKTDQFTDAPFSRAETAGISVLVDAGAIEGNPDGSFAPRRTLNRAEFVKIALLSAGETVGDAANCFPDVRSADWFSPYICAAKDRGIVEGNPDGMFHPERSVNYVEALKILVELHGYDLPEPPANERWAWYTPYWKVAEARGVLLPITLAYEASLMRGQMARLAAAFLAESEGNLSFYRAFERGDTVPVSSSSSVESMSSSSAAVSSSVASSSESSAAPSALFPATSHFLLAGETSKPVMSGDFTALDEDAFLRYVDVELRREMRSIEKLFLVDETGKELATLSLTLSNNTDKKKWRGTVSDDSYRFIAGKPVTLGIAARIKDKNNGGASNELLQPQKMSIIAQGVTSGGSQQMIPTNLQYPFHQSVLSRIAAVRAESTSAILAGSKRQMGVLTVTASPTDASALIESIRFALEKSNVALSNVRIGGLTDATQQGCIIDPDGMHVLCDVPSGLQVVEGEGRILHLFADVALMSPATSGTLRLTFDERGAVGTAGTIHWSDNTGHFTWIDETTQLTDMQTITVTAQ